MSINTRNGTAYYRCTNRRKRHTCDNSLGIREDDARRGILAQLRTLLTDRECLTIARKRIVQRLRAMLDRAGEELAELRRNLRKTEKRIQRLIEHLADGNQSDYVKTSLQSLEAKAESIKAAIAQLEKRTQASESLPSVDAILAAFCDVEALLYDDVQAGREYLRCLFKDSGIEMIPQGQSYVARSEVFPAVLVTFDTAKRKRHAARPLASDLGAQQRRRGKSHVSRALASDRDVQQCPDAQQRQNPDAQQCQQGTDTQQRPHEPDAQQRRQDKAADRPVARSGLSASALDTQQCPKGKRYVARLQVSASASEPAAPDARTGSVESPSNDFTVFADQGG